MDSIFIRASYQYTYTRTYIHKMEAHQIQEKIKLFRKRQNRDFFKENFIRNYLIREKFFYRKSQNQETSKLGIVEIY